MSEPGDLPPVSLPEGALLDEEVAKTILAMDGDLRLWPLRQLLDRLSPYREYDAALILAQQVVRNNLDNILEKEMFWAITSFADQYLGPAERALLARRYSRDRDQRTRQWAQDTLRKAGALPPDAWDWTAWKERTRPGRLYRHAVGASVLADKGLPAAATVGELRALLRVPSRGQLGWLLQASEGPYRSFTIPKASGGAREIDAPNGQLRRVQRRILDEILARVPAHEAAHGFVRGRSTATNAQAHVGRDLLVKFDLKDFFPTVNYWRVVGLFASLGYDPGDLRLSTADDSRSVAPALARLCVYAADSSEYGGGHAPQGAPTSPAVCNLVCRGLDARLHGLTAEMGGAYTRYADDLTFSFPAAASASVGRLRWWVEEICRQEGFKVNQEKFRVIRRSQRQLVTGVVVNDAPRVPREDRRRFRAILHNCRKHGLASQANGRPDFAGYLRGFASYIHMIHPEEGKALLAEVEAILAGGAP